MNVILQPCQHSQYGPNRPFEYARGVGRMPAMTATRILLIDDHAMFRTGLRMVLKNGIANSEFFEANSLADALSSPLADVDIILLDLILKGPPGQNGLEGIAPLKLKWPSTPLLVVTSQDDQETARLSLSLGASAFISKAETAEKIVAVTNLFLQDPTAILSPASYYPAQRRLTPRQQEVLNLLHKGLSNKLIAQQLTLSDNTVRRHVQDILEFFGVVSRAEAVFAARSQGLVE
jgi:DNA-binding NarL/FixJ family response regulator